MKKNIYFNKVTVVGFVKNLIPNGLEEYMAFFFNKNLVFIDIMQFINSSLDKLVENLSDEDLKYLIETKR